MRKSTGANETEAVLFAEVLYFNRYAHNDCTDFSRLRRFGCIDEAFYIDFITTEVDQISNFMLGSF